VRVLLFAGRGGAGTTTVAAATAVTAARGGIKTLLLSTDRTSSLTDVLGLPPLRGGAPDDDDGVEHGVEPGLAVLHVEPSRQPVGAWATVQRYLEDLPGVLQPDDAPAPDLLSLPGSDDLVTLACLVEQARSGPWDLVVADVAGGGEALRLLTAPDTLLRLLDGLWSPQRLLGLRQHRPAPLVAQAVARLREVLSATRDVLRSPTTSVRLVLAPESLGLTKARRAFTALAVHGYVVDGLVANKVVENKVVANEVVGDGAEPPSSDQSWPTTWATAQSRVLAEADESFAPLRVRRLPHLPVEPIGPGALAALGAHLLEGSVGSSRGVEALLAAPTTAASPQVRRTPDGYDLVLHAPFVTAADVDLSRDGDELRLRVQGTQRVLALPSVLRRCVATAAQVTAGRIVVRFQPDAELWPSRHPSDDPTTTEGQA
jgi:arsenite/tail-anchored protein-transporting ATPase